MPLQVFGARPSRQEEADHLEGSLGGLAAGVEHDQQAGNDAAIDLNLHSIGFRGQEMAAAEQLLEHSEEVLDQPSQSIHLADEFSGQIEAIRGDPQEDPGERRAWATLCQP